MKTRRRRYLVDQVRRHFLLLHRLVRLDQHAILVWRHFLSAEDGARGVRKRLDVDAALHGQTEPAANPLPEGGDLVEKTRQPSSQMPVTIMPQPTGIQIPERAASVV